MQILIATLLPVLINAFGSVMGKSVSAFNALPRDERRAKLTAGLRSKWLLTSPPAALAARQIAKSPTGLNMLLDALESHGGAGVAAVTGAAHAAAAKHAPMSNPHRSGGRMARVRSFPSIPTLALDRLDVTRARRNGGAHVSPDTLTTLNVGDRFVIRSESDPDRDSLTYTVTGRRFDEVKAESATGAPVTFFADAGEVSMRGGRGVATVYAIRRVNGYSRRRNCGGDCACAPCQAARTNPRTRKNGKADYYAIVVDTAGNEHMVGPMSLLAAKDRIRALESKGMPDGRGGLRPLKHGAGHVRSAQAVQSTALLKYRNPAVRRNPEYVLWGLPEGQTDALYQKILYTQGKTMADVERVKGMASREGWHSFRVQTIDTSKPFDAGAAFARGVRRNPEYVLWGLPEGQTDALYQKILYTQGKTMADVERVKGMASREGWHSFRVQTIDTSKPFDAGAAFARGVRRNHHIRVGGTFYTPSGRRGMVLGASRKGFYPVRWSDGTLGTVQDTETAAYPTEGSRANRGAARRNGKSVWYAKSLTGRTATSTLGPFSSVAEAKRTLAERYRERGPWGKLQRAQRNDGQYTAYYVGDDWSIESIGPEWAF